MPSDAKPKGPASYSPSIEKAHGKPIGHWFAVLDTLQGKKPREQVPILEAEHGLGHGHAIALAACWRAKAG